MEWLKGGLKRQGVIHNKESSSQEVGKKEVGQDRLLERGEWVPRKGKD